VSFKLKKGRKEIGADLEKNYFVLDCVAKIKSHEVFFSRKF